jgi:4-hydroxybenzoate polyprenyltransferase
MLRHYISIARPSHWFKSIFVLPGIMLAALITKINLLDYIPHIIFGLLSISLISSANYTINEWLDADFDKFHPLKKGRASVLGYIQYKYVMLQYIFLTTAGLSLSYLTSFPFLVINTFFLIMGLLYNVHPFRTKDKQYLDVLSESINNPIRLVLGWLMISSSILPPSSIIIAFWMGGAFLMAVKRYAELRLIADKTTASLYRKSFESYTEENLLVSILFYAMMFSFFFGIFMIKYRIELLISLPLFAGLFAWYLHIGMAQNSSAQRPEQLYKEKYFMLYVISLVLVICSLLFITIPSLTWFLSVPSFSK